MTRKKAEMLLVGVILARSTSYLFTKIGLEHLGTFNLASLRFTAAFLLLALLFRKRLLQIRPATLWRGLLMGGLFFAVVAAELTALRTTPTSTTSFLENTAIVFVPLFEALLRRRMVRPRVLAGTAAALLGVGLLTLRESFALTSGEWWCILAAALYAASIILTDRLTRREDPLILGILQIGFVALFSVLASFLFETPRLPSGGAEWGAILALALVCTVFGLTLQPVAQRGTTSERTGLYCALNPVSAALLGTVFLRERLGLRGVAGAALVLAALFLSLERKTPEAEADPSGNEMEAAAEPTESGAEIAACAAAQPSVPAEP